MFQRAGIKKPSAEDVREILKSVSADDYVDLRSKIAWFQDSVLNEAGLPRVYSVYRDILESATKVVKEFENPKLFSKEIEFQISDQPHLNKEPKSQLLAFIDSEVETLAAMAKKRLTEIGTVRFQAILHLQVFPQEARST